jgi:CHAT domain-containing protein
MKRWIVGVALGVALSQAAVGQRQSRAPDEFWKDISNLAGLSQAGRFLIESDPVRRAWGDYCASSQELARRGQFREAVRMAARALFLANQQNSNGFGGANIYAKTDIATAYSLAGNHQQAGYWADSAFESIRQGYENWVQPNLPVIRANLHRIKALQLMHEGKAAEALAEVQKGADALPRFGAPFVRAEYAITTSSLLLRAGRVDDAATEIAKVQAETDPGIVVPALRTQADIALRRGKPAEALPLLDRALAVSRERQLALQVVMVELSRARAQRALGDKAAARSSLLSLIREAEAARQTFSSAEIRQALSGGLQDVFDEAVDFFATEGDWASAFAASEAGRARAMLDLQAKVGGQVVSQATPSKSLREVQQALRPDQRIISYHQLPQQLVALVISRERIEGRVLRIGGADLLRRVNQFRKQIEDEDRATQASAQALFDDLVRPLLPLGLEGRELIVIPHRALHMLPIHALHDGRRWLIEASPVATELSASLVRGGTAAAPRNGLVALGNPELGRKEWDLPGSEAEVQAIRALYSDPVVMLRTDATKERLVKAAPGSLVLHVAAHAVVDETDPMFSTIKLTRTAPLGSDLEARELAQLNLSSARMVVLSACNSGAGKVAAGDEFLGFKRAVFSAGADSALLTLWPVDDESTRVLMTHFHTAWRNQTRTQALRAAKLKLLADPQFRSPFYWAPFVLVGNPN